MTQTLTLPADLVADLERQAKAKGFGSVEAWLRRWQKRQAKQEARRRAFEEIEQIKAEMSAKYGRMPDSVELLREDRER